LALTKKNVVGSRLLFSCHDSVDRYVLIKKDGSFLWGGGGLSYKVFLNVTVPNETIHCTIRKFHQTDYLM